MKILFLLISFLSSTFVYSQINAYARVTSIVTSTLTLSNVNQVSHTFVVGEDVVVMQMQDDVIGGNTSDNAAFGDLGAINSAGNYEIRRITAINGNVTPGFSTPTPTNITVIPLGNTYNTGVNSSVQIISFRLMSLTNFTTTSPIVALPWNGNIGGVIAMQVPGTLTLAHSISANGQGFRGGGISNIFNGGTCGFFPFRTSNLNNGFKGEGIYRATNVLFTNSRAKILNGGGGGNETNAGGGGGGNFFAGGLGGHGWNGTSSGCPAATSAGGFGGISLSAVIANNRIFMGGGGGGGQINNSVGTSGGNGGGIILLKAGTVRTLPSCPGLAISANGNSVPFSGDDGGGGGGAAGTIVFWVDNWLIDPACILNVSSNGGNGGNVNAPLTYGGGGAGAQGVVMFNGSVPITNTSTTTLNGAAGCSNNSNPCNSFAGSASGVNNSGIFSNINSPLPIELIEFNAILSEDNSVNLDWKTATEKNNDFFTIERSQDGYDWSILSKQKGAGNSQSIIRYFDVDKRPFAGQSYYRLKQTDFNGESSYSELKSINLEHASIVIVPNPSNDFVTIFGVKNNEKVQFFDMLGKEVTLKINEVNNQNSHSYNIFHLENGVYFVRVNDQIIKFSKVSE